MKREHLSRKLLFQIKEPDFARLVHDPIFAIGAFADVVYRYKDPRFKSPLGVLHGIYMDAANYFLWEDGVLQRKENFQQPVVTLTESDIAAFRRLTVRRLAPLNRLSDPGDLDPYTSFIQTLPVITGFFKYAATELESRFAVSERATRTAGAA